MRPIVFALALLLASCGPEPLEILCVPGESRACACTSGASGAQVCGDDRQHFGPCTCDAADGGGENDAAARDAEVGDGGPVDAAPPAIPGECTLVPQSGCGVGQACRLAISGDEAMTECRAGGVGRDGAPCGADSDCAAGLFCAVTGACHRFCLTGAPDCPFYRHPWCQPEPAAPGLGWCSEEPSP